jgi:predicted transcriptional regulator
MSLSYVVALPLPAEIEILELLWCHGGLTVKELHALLVTRRAVSYRAVKTMLNLMQAKGFVEKQFLEQPTLYCAVCSKSELQQFALTHLAHLFFDDDMNKVFYAVLNHPELDKKLVTPAPTPLTKQVN